MKKLIPFLLAATILAGGCEKSIKINLPDQARKIVVNSVMRLGEPIHASLTRTLSNAESSKGNFFQVTGAQILLYRDGQEVGRLDSVDVGVYASPVPAEPGHRYKLVISHPQYATTEAEADAPEPVPIISVRRDAMVRDNPDKGTEDLLNIRFRDPAAAGDHYILQVIGSGERDNLPLDFYSWRSCINATDPSIESPYASSLPGDEECFPSLALFVRDVQFNGQEKELRMYGSSYNLQPNPGWEPGMDSSYAAVRMYHVTPEFYRFVKSYRGAEDASGNPFAEPFNVSTNVKNGYGVFAILAEEEVELR
jgi:hypothetical protein